jgi:hypothetical protein
MNAVNKQPKGQDTEPTVSALLNRASESSTNLMDPILAVRLIVSQRWDSGYAADTARNALDWISKKMEEECDLQRDALDSLMACEVQA